MFFKAVIPAKQVRGFIFRERTHRVKTFKRHLGIWLMGILSLAACQSQAAPLPTLVSAQSLQTLSAQTASPTLASGAEALANATESPTRSRQLPPTFTPTAILSPTPSQVIALSPSATPRPFQAEGDLYYLYNSDALIRTQLSDTTSQVVMQFGMGQVIRDFAVSPDASLLAFVAPSVGNSQEVHLMNRDGSYLLQVSCLQFADVRAPPWTADGLSLAFYAAQTPQEAGNLYISDWQGSNNCPEGNRQRLLLTDALRFGGFALSPSLLLFSSTQGIEGVDLSTNQRSIYAPATGMGVDIRLTLNAQGDQLAYITPNFNRLGKLTTSATLLNVGLVAPSTPDLPPRLVDEALDIVWNSQGTAFLISTQNGLYLAQPSGSLRALIAEGLREPVAAFNPAGTQIVYSAPDANGISQLFIYDLANQQSHQITQHSEGNITQVLWLKG